MFMSAIGYSTTDQRIKKLWFTTKYDSDVTPYIYGLEKKPIVQGTRHNFQENSH